MTSYGFEWASICLEQSTAAAGLRASFAHAPPSGAPYATLSASDGTSLTLQVAEDTLVIVAEIATDMGDGAQRGGRHRRGGALGNVRAEGPASDARVGQLAVAPNRSAATTC